MDIVQYKTADGADIALSAEIVRNVICNGNQNLTQVEILQFINLCKYNGLNPFLKEAYLVKYKGKNGDKCNIIVSKETFLKRAESNPDYDGSKSGIFVMRENKLEKVVGTMMLKDDVLVGGWAEVHRKNQSTPTEITVSLAEYHQDNTMWNSKPATMIRKVALVQALREAFSKQLGSCYDEAEVPIETTATVVESKAPTSVEAKQETKAIEPQKDKFEMGKAKVLAYLCNKDLASAQKGLEWLKQNYADRPEIQDLENIVKSKSL